jgi:hypothetical protein
MAKKNLKIKKTDEEKIKKEKTVKVYHIVRYFDRYEINEKINRPKKKPHAFWKAYVSPEDNESANYFKQIAILKTKPKWLELKGALDELITLASGFSRCYRGYLLDEKFEAASSKKIAQWLGYEPKAMTAILATLEDVGFIERVPLPDFDTSVDEDLSENAGNQGQTGTKSGRGGQPLKKGETEVQSQSGSGSDNGNNNPNSKENEKNQNPQVNGTKDSTTINPNPNSKQENNDKGHQEAQSPTKTVSPSPISPTSSDVSGGGKLLTSAADIPLNSVLNESSADTQAQFFASEVYKLLGISHPPGTTAAKQELLNYYHAWLAALKSGLPPDSLLNLWQDSMDEARKIGKEFADKRLGKRKKGGWSKPGKGFRYLFNSRLQNYKSKVKK